MPLINTPDNSLSYYHPGQLLIFHYLFPSLCVIALRSWYFIIDEQKEKIFWELFFLQLSLVCTWLEEQFYHPIPLISYKKLQLENCNISWRQYATETEDFVLWEETQVITRKQPNKH